MADNTSRMIALLGSLRREMNGAVADSMSYYGTRYGLNYGVSLPTIRAIAAKEERDNTLALYLYKQDVRELRLAALHLAQPESFDVDATTWMEGITTSEIAEEMAYALLRHVESLPMLFDNWSRSGKELPTYAVLMAAARKSIIQTTLYALSDIICQYPESRLIAQGMVALLSAAMITKSAEEIKEILKSLPQCKASEYINDEMAWRME